MIQQYYITVPWNSNIRNAGTDSDELITITELLPGAALPTNAGKFQLNCILNKLGTGLYTNTGTVAVPSFTPLGGGGGTPAGLDSWVQYNNAGVFGADVNFVRDPGGAFFGVRSQLAPTIAGQYVQDNDIFGFGINGVANIYSDDNFATYFIGTFAGDFTSTGGESNLMIVGYQSITGGAVANTTYSYDTVGNISDVRIDASTLTTQAQINLTASTALGTEDIEFNFGGGKRYSFPITSPGVGEVIGYTAPNQLGWVTPGGITINDTVGASTADSVLYVNSTNKLQNSLNFTYEDTIGRFRVNYLGAVRLNIDPANNVYSMGATTGSGNKTQMVIDDQVGSKAISMFAGREFNVYNDSSPGERYFYVGTASTQRGFTGGDVDGVYNSTYIQAYDTGKVINLQNTGLTKIGDMAGLINGTGMQFDDFSSQVFIQTDGDFGVQTVVGQRGMEVNFAGGTDFTFQAGDVNGITNGTKVAITDSAQLIQHTALHHRMNLVEYANNAAAIVGGLAVGDLYQTTVGGDAFVKRVI